MRRSRSFITDIPVQKPLLNDHAWETFDHHCGPIISGGISPGQDTDLLSQMERQQDLARAVNSLPVQLLEEREPSRVVFNVYETAR